MDDRQLIDAKTLGTILRVSRRTVFRLNSLAKIPEPVRIGGAIRWRAEEISAWLAAGAPDRETWETRERTER